MNQTTTTSATIHPSIPIDSCRGVLVLTNDSDDPGIAAARAAAAELAVRCDVPLTLYDRSEETWGDSQHPDGPMEPGDPRLDQRAQLRDQMAGVAAMGARPLGWVSTLPSIGAVLTALADVGADVVVVPVAMKRRLLERALEGATLSEALQEQLDRHAQQMPTVVEIDVDGTATIV